MATGTYDRFYILMLRIKSSLAALVASECMSLCVGLPIILLAER